MFLAGAHTYKGPLHPSHIGAPEAAQIAEPSLSDCSISLTPSHVSKLDTSRRLVVGHLAQIADKQDGPARSTWPTESCAQDIMHEPMYIFERPNGKTGYQRDTVQTASEKLIVSIKCESANSKAPK